MTRWSQIVWQARALYCRFINPCFDAKSAAIKIEKCGKIEKFAQALNEGLFRAEKAQMYLLRAQRRPRATARTQLRRWAGVLNGRRLGRPARRRRGSSSAPPSPAALSSAYRQDRDSVRGEKRRRDAILSSGYHRAQYSEN